MTTKMKEQVIITTVNICRQGERKHFQMTLPKDTRQIIGVECGGRMLSVIPADVPPTPISNLFQQNKTIGEFKLQGCGTANWFYASEVLWQDANLGDRDFSNTGFSVKDFSHGKNRIEDTVKVDAESNMLNGWYSDLIGKNSQSNIQYEVKIYVWINTEA